MLLNHCTYVVIAKPCSVILSCLLWFPVPHSPASTSVSAFALPMAPSSPLSSLPLETSSPLSELELSSIQPGVWLPTCRGLRRVCLVSFNKGPVCFLLTPGTPLSGRDVSFLSGNATLGYFYFFPQSIFFPAKDTIVPYLPLHAACSALGRSFLPCSAQETLPASE